MVEIIPNWHPIFVHYTVALLSLAAALFVVTPFLKAPLQDHWRIVARWSLWFGVGFSLITGLTGLYAYNTVAHDTPSHIAMTDHRNWAIATISLFLIVGVWSAIRVRRNQALGAVFVSAMVIASGVLASTAWRGGEVVYRYGLGVISLPKSEGDGHNHEHANGGGHSHPSEMPHEKTTQNTDHHAHDNMLEAEHSHDDLASPSTDTETVKSGGSGKPDHQHNDDHHHDH